MRVLHGHLNDDNFNKWIRNKGREKNRILETAASFPRTTIDDGLATLIRRGRSWRGGK